ETLYDFVTNIVSVDFSSSGGSGSKYVDLSFPEPTLVDGCSFVVSTPVSSSSVRISYTEPGQSQVWGYTAPIEGGQVVQEEHDCGLGGPKLINRLRLQVQTPGPAAAQFYEFRASYGGVSASLP